ncbi:MAG: hypothetical protein ACK56I_06760, partial [bacterium]
PRLAARQPVHHRILPRLRGIAIAGIAHLPHLVQAAHQIGPRPRPLGAKPGDKRSLGLGQIGLGARNQGGNVAHPASPPCA